MSVETGNEDEGHSTPELADNNRSEEIKRDEECEPDGEREEAEEEEYCFYRLERLVNHLDGAVGLRPDLVFIQSINAQVPTIKREKFHYRFKSFLQESTQHIPAPEILDDLLKLAIQAIKQITAWENTVAAVKSDEFSSSLDCLRAEVERFEKMRKVFRYARKLPSWMSSWERLWIEAFEELEEEIEAQLKCAKNYLEQLSRLAKLGRAEVESVVLLQSEGSIRNVIAKTPLSKIPRITLAAFAYAAQLVPWHDDDNDGKAKYVDAIEARLRRAEHSKAGTEILVTLLMASCQSPEPGAKEESPPPRGN